MTLALLCLATTAHSLMRSMPRSAPIVARTGKTEMRTPVSEALLVGDSAVLLGYSFGLSALRAVAAAAESAPPSDTFNWASDLATLDMHLSLQFVTIEQCSATCLVLTWLIGASRTGVLEPEWLAQARPESFDVGRSLLPTWYVSAPLFFVAKAIGTAAVIVPVGGWLAFDLPTAFADLGGQLGIVTLWRTLLVQSLR